MQKKSSSTVFCRSYRCGILGLLKKKTIGRINGGNIGFCWSWICFNGTFFGGYKNHSVKVRMTSCFCWKYLFWSPQSYLETPWFPVKIMSLFLPQTQLEISCGFSLTDVETLTLTLTQNHESQRIIFFLTLTEWFLRLNLTRTEMWWMSCCFPGHRMVVSR